MRKQIAVLVIAVLLLIVPLKVMAEGVSVSQTEKLISEIGTVTRENRESVVRAVEAYNNLSETEKAAVSNFRDLEEAQQVLGLEDALWGMYIKYDEVENTYFITAPIFLQCIDRGESCVMVAMYLHENQKAPGLMVNYISMANKYIDIEKIAVNIDGENITFDKNSFTGKGKAIKAVEYNQTSKHYEWMLRKATPEDIELLRKMVEAKEVDITFWGGTEKFFGEDVRKRSQYQMIPNVRWGIDDVIKLYDIYQNASSEARSKALIMSKN